jgi:hypothetical protein
VSLTVSLTVSPSLCTSQPRWSLPRWAPTARDVDELYLSLGTMWPRAVDTQGLSWWATRAGGVDELYLFWDGKAKRSVCSTRAAAAEVFVVVVRFVGPLMGGLWVWGVVVVTQCCHRGEGLATPPRHQSGHRLRVLRLQHNSVSVNMFGPLLRLLGSFSASFQCYSLTSRDEG